MAAVLYIDFVHARGEANRLLAAHQLDAAGSRPSVVGETRQWRKRHWKTEVVSSLEMLSGRSKKKYAREAEAVAADPDAAP